METKVLDHITGMPAWMQFIIILVILGSYLYLTIVNKRAADSAKATQIEMSNKMNTLLDTLQERFSNEVTKEFAYDIIYLWNDSIKYNILEVVLRSLYDENNKDTNGKFIYANIEDNLRIFIKNKFNEANLSLSKARHKDIQLNFYIKDINIDAVYEEISKFMQCRNTYTNERLFKDFKIKCNNIFDTFTNEAYNKLETIKK